MDLFEKNEERNNEHARPLSLRMCPEALEDFHGQEHIVGKGKLLRRAIEADRLSSVILHGPPGTGKTALATVISKKTGAHFMKTNAVSSNVKEIRDIIDLAERQRKLYGKKSILLLDEIHRFNKAQQDVLMPAVEKGQLILIGTTTENPFFSVNSALLSRSQVFEFKALDEKDLRLILDSAIADPSRGLGAAKVKCTEEALNHLAKIADGDARKALNALELAVITTKAGTGGIIEITLNEAEDSIQKKSIVYDRDGDAHYDTKSAYIKSMRGSDPDAALYWLAKMIVGGEDPRVISRRLVICASEDVGNADPRALVVANAAMQAAEFIGFPEAKIPLAQATIYVACAPKSNASYMAIENAIQDVTRERTQEVPDHLKDAHYPGAKRLSRGEGYKYAHSYDGHYTDQEYMREKRKYYTPTNMGFEKKIAEWLKTLRDMKNE
ncbi:MAG: replication-associated recombination protein A [Candidatus Omnitrophica bacterium]|nr:replication-associated recombination protein A [Candidatus Omnitrophota bacterium]MBU1128299.1 replication-associated recombination protein A [Candidatus Omnitrophota bacterium]MBU1784135.1 replication-associated recombination protein A [Candidatus Omnitrophota bacterium]